MSTKQNFVSRLDMADVVKQHKVFDVFVQVAKMYPNLASELFKKYVEYIRANNKFVLSVEEARRQNIAEHIANENIGYFIGNCDKYQERKFLFGVYPTAYHPILGREY